MEEYSINIESDFNRKLGGRWKALGPFSGEAFFDDHLEPCFLKAQANKGKLHIFFDGASPYGSSFLDQSFGELARKYGNKIVSNIIVFHTSYYEWIEDFIRQEIWK
jgi:hypothetical protein